MTRFLEQSLLYMLPRGGSFQCYSNILNIFTQYIGACALIYWKVLVTMRREGNTIILVVFNFAAQRKYVKEKKKRVSVRMTALLCVNIVLFIRKEDQFTSSWFNTS